MHSKAFQLSVGRLSVLCVESTTGDGPVQRIALREPCTGCGCNDGVIDSKGGQDVVRCAWCKAYCFNASRVETGRERRSLSTRPDVRPRQRSRILRRDNFTCIKCHHSDKPLEIGHLVSVHDGHLVGLSDSDLSTDENLAVMCAECNAGLFKESLPPHLVAAAIFAMRLREKENNDGNERGLPA